MINYALYLQLKERLLDVAGLSALLRSGSGAYYRAALRFLDEVCEFAANNRLDVSSGLAVEQQKLLAFGTGAHRTGGRERDSYAVSRIENAVGQIKTFLDKYESAFSQCESICRQIVAQTAASGVVKADDVLYLMRTNDSLKAYYGQLVGMVGALNLRTVTEVVIVEMSVR